MCVYIQTVNRETTVKGSDNNDYYLVEVIGLILKNVREGIERHFIAKGSTHRVEDFGWVLTVPALWGARARDMMREAAYAVSICLHIHIHNYILFYKLNYRYCLPRGKVMGLVIIISPCYYIMIYKLCCVSVTRFNICVGCNVIFSRVYHQGLWI